MADSDQQQDEDNRQMRRAVGLAHKVRAVTSPNPWVGCVVVSPDGVTYEGATEAPGGRHAEIVALDAAGPGARGSTLYCTLEPCSHVGRTPACAGAIVDAGVGRVVVGVEDPDSHVAGTGLDWLQQAGIDTVRGTEAALVEEQLAPYLKHRATGRPWVVLKLAASMDGRTAAPDGSSRWITGEAARADAHRLRAESDAIIVGAGTIRADDPSLTVRYGHEEAGRQPLRVVLGEVPPEASVRPALEMVGPLEGILDELGTLGVLQAMVEGGPMVAGEFHRRLLVDRYVLYLAPGLFGGDDGRPLFSGPGVGTVGDLWRGRLVSVQQLDGDIRVELEAEGGASVAEAA